MAVLRIHKKQQNFVILDKTCLNDKCLSWGAKGLHAYLMSLPDDWRVRVSDLKDRATNGRDAVRGLLSELERAGYIQKSNCRDEASGRFEGIEYLVLEIPEPKDHALIPAPENTSSVNKSHKTPAPENPSLDFPAPEKTTLLNNKDTNNPNNQVINKTAADCTLECTEALQASPKSAAVISFQKQAKKMFTPEDAVIGEHLTENQKRRVHQVVSHMAIGEEERLMEEMCYCLLNKTHFSGCGTDFSKKLNAIRSVILKGNWFTPAGMVQEPKESTNTAHHQLEKELREAHAEAIHFQRLLDSAKESMKEGLEELVKKAHLKMERLKQLIREETSHQPVLG